MKLSQFVDLFVAALYNETELTGRSDFTIGQIAEKYGLKLSPAWGESLFKDYDFSSRVETHRHIGPAEQQHVSLSSGGYRWVEDELGENVTEFLERNGAQYEYQAPAEAPFDPAIFDPAIFDTGEQATQDERIHSEDWTGIAAQVITAQNSDQVRAAILKAKDAVRDLGSNEKTAQAMAFLQAAEALIEAPEPPSDLIWELINRAGAICGVISLFITLFTVS